MGWVRGCGERLRCAPSGALGDENPVADEKTLAQAPQPCLAGPRVQAKNVLYSLSLASLAA